MAVMGELWAVAKVAGPLDVRVMVRGVTAYSRSVGSTPVMLITDGVQDDALIVQNLSVSPIELGPDRSITFGQGISVPARSQWSPRGGVQSIWASPNYYDRNPLSIEKSWGSGGFIAPAGPTTRWNYTVPSGRRAFLEALDVSQEIGTPATTRDQTLTTIGVGPDAITAFGTPIISAQWFGVNVQGAIQTKTIGTSIELQEGDVLVALTSNLSIGGTVAHSAFAKITEFDK